MSQQQPINILKMFKNFFACKIVVAANQRYSEKFKDFSDSKIVLAATHQYSENVQKLFRLQNCRSRKSAISWKHSKIFPPAKTSQPQTICILETFKDFFGCKNVLVATHQNSENIQGLFRLQNCLRRKTSISCKSSKTFSPAKLSSPQIIDILEIFKDFFACKFFLAATYHYSEKLQSFPPAKLSQPQIIDILEIFEEFFACKLVLAANHRYAGNIQKFFRLQK